MLIGSISMLAVIILAMLRVPLAFALLGVSIVGMGLAVSWQTAFLLVPITISDAVFSYDLAVVPMFILMGNVIAKTGIARDLFKAAFAFVGHMRGGLALSTMIACSGFSAVCGSSYATAATMTKVAYPSLKRYGYSDKISAGTIAAGGTLGIMIPPSIIMVVYGILTQTNIGHLFVAGVLPGLLGLGLYLLVIVGIATRRPSDAPKGDRASWAERLASIKGVWPFILLFGLIIGGLYGKLFTPTEAAGMGAGLSILIAFLHGRLNPATLKKVIVETAYTSVSLYAVLFGAMLFSKLLTLSGLAGGLLGLVQLSGLDGLALIFCIMAVFLVLGCVMDSMAMILIFVPLFAPIVASQGFDLVWFGILIIIVTEIALITPPMGMNVFVMKSVLPDVPVLRIFSGLVPFIAVDVVRLVLLVAFPVITLWLGSTVG
ncbi:MAG: TRAP transporter large permease [Thalassospira sp.]|uniref:TRAP transporter large permease n=1 Tax=Thalassospira sp. TaxID=1912094 RepID=UPI003A8494F9